MTSASWESTKSTGGGGGVKLYSMEGVEMDKNSPMYTPHPLGRFCYSAKDAVVISNQDGSLLR